MTGVGFLGALLVLGVAIVVAGLTVAYVLVPVFKGIGWAIANFFRAVGWLIAHVFEFVGGVISDTLRLIGALLVGVLLMPFAPLNVILGRWSAAGHFAESVRRELSVAGACLYRLLIRRPLKLLWLHGMLEGVEQRLPQAMAAAPTSDHPSRRTGQFAGYRIVGSLRGGGSGAKLYVAEPDSQKRARIPGLSDRVVIKSFTISEGSSLPQIVRESRALECAKQLGLVFEHGLDDHRFFYVMPYHAGDHLGVITRQLHGESSGRGLEEAGLRTVGAYTCDLLETLSLYHRGGLWHKDVKPENVIVHDGSARLVDLGLVTPLRSAMTLTTHGTEYFRDPEMVRQALRGVRVHQVDGTKFDIYAAGAVLYFMLENTFPAHGGLSNFAKKSPEALRWIVRRSMADYNQRYDSVDAMLADLRTATAAPDLYAVRPVDLPSVSGDASPAVQETPERVVAAARTPVPLSPVLETARAAAPVAAPSAIRVTNWWTGAYAVGPTQAAPAEELDRESAFRREAQDFRDQAREINRQVRAGSLSARKAAREQIKSARSRARDLQRRVRHRRHEALAERQPTPMLAAAVLAFLGVAGLAAFGFYQASRSPYSVAVLDTVKQTVAGPIGEDEEASQRPVMLVVEGDDPHRLSARTSIKKIMQEREEQGYHVLIPESGATNEQLVSLLRNWSEDTDGPADARLEDLLEERNLYGLVWVTVHPSQDGPQVRDTLIYSTRSGANVRRHAEDLNQVRVEASSSPLLLVNDHPARGDAEIEARIQRALAEYGRPVIADLEAEAAVRGILPPGPIDENRPVSARLNHLLQRLGYSGVVRIDGSDETAIVLSRVDAKPIETQVELDVPDVPAVPPVPRVPASAIGVSVK